MAKTRVTRGKRIKYDKLDYIPSESDEVSRDTDEVIGTDDDLRKSRIRDTNKEFARRMTLLQTWSDYWSDYTTREGEAYSKVEARAMIKKTKKIHCPIQACRKVFTTIGGLRYHYARCNIERCFKCKVCSPPSEYKTRGDLLRHMIRLHYEGLPDLNDDQKDIANSFLTSTGRTDKFKGRKSTGDPESQANAKTYVKSYSDLVANSTSFEALERRPFSLWKTFGRDWELLTTDLDRRRFCPPETESVRFKSSTKAHWHSIRTGDSIVMDSDGALLNSVIFFTGGVNSSAAWLPKPNRIKHEQHKEHIAIAVRSCPMDKSVLYKDSKDIAGSIQFWSTNLFSGNLRDFSGTTSKPQLEFMIGHHYGIISEMNWCPLGTSWEPPTDTKSTTCLPRLGLLALACGDGQIRIISVPHYDQLLLKNHPGPKRLNDHLDNIPMFKVKPIATLMPPGVGSSTDYQPVVCTSISWNVDDNQRLIAAGYSNGTVALFDLSNYSPILFSNTEHRHVYQPYKMWLAHCLPVVGVGLLSDDIERTLVATGSRDRHLKLWNSRDLNSCITFDRAPITRLVWDYRLRGIVAASEAAFTSFHNRVSYRYPVADGSAGITVSTHRATVWGLSNSIVTSALATADEAGEVFISPTGRPCHKRTKSYFDTFSLFTLLPRSDGKRTEKSPSSFMRPTTVSENGLTTTSILMMSEHDQLIELPDNNNAEPDDINDEIPIDDDYTFAERPIANKPAKFLLPDDERAIDTYSDFKENFGLEFVEYDAKMPRKDQKLPEAWLRAGSASNIYCDRVCDYPFSSVKHLSWSPNINSFSFLLSATHVGLCRIDRVKVLELIYKGHLDNMSNTQISQEGPN